MGPICPKELDSNRSKTWNGSLETLVYKIKLDTNAPCIWKMCQILYKLL